MKNVFFALLCVVSINLFSNGNSDGGNEFYPISNGNSESTKLIVNTWECNETKIVLYTNSTCLVGNLTYNVKYLNKDLMSLYIGDKAFLLAIFADSDNTLIVKSTDDEKDIKHFSKCK